jgi:hypothetical protein
VPVWIVKRCLPALATAFARRSRDAASSCDDSNACVRDAISAFAERRISEAGWGGAVMEA